jgi:hypothetical protein
MAEVDYGQSLILNKNMLSDTAQGTVVNPRFVEIKPLPE